MSEEIKVNVENGMSPEEADKALLAKKIEDQNVYNGLPKSLSFEEFENCMICKKWVSICITEPDFSKDQIAAEKWCKDRNDFWVLNKTHLEEKGFTQHSSYAKAIDFINYEKYKVKDLESSLLIFKIGSDSRPTSPTEIKKFKDALQVALEGIKGIRILVTHNDVHLEKVSLGKLRELQSELLMSQEKEDEGSFILDL